jgi:hypothetical protein
MNKPFPAVDNRIKYYHVKQQSWWKCSAKRN